MNMKLKIFAPLAMVAVLATSGCVHKLAKQQGHLLEKEKVAELALGQSKAKVRDLMGTPLLKDSFHEERWDYVYKYVEGNGSKTIQQVISLYFDDSDRLARIRNAPPKR